jgi:subtilisin
MANRRAGKFREVEKAESREALHAALTLTIAGSNVIRDTDPTDGLARRVVVFESTAEEVEQRRRQFGPDVLVEPEIMHWPDAVAPMDFLEVGRSAFRAAVLSGIGTTTTLRIRGGGQSLRGADVTLFLRGPGGLNMKLEQTTPKTGKVVFEHSAFWTPAAVVVVPAGGFWSVVVRAPSDNDKIDCPPLPRAADRLGWWHSTMGIGDYQEERGEGIRVGVIDTGVGPHPYLDHVKDIGAFIDDDTLPPPEGHDVDSHGTHVCGIIGARPTVKGDFAGIAPGVELHSARVFPPDRGASQADIANAIDELSRVHQVDLINMSLGAEQPSEIERDAILDALERGTLCVCAAANSNGPPGWPARFEETVAVSALGLDGWGPPGTLAANRLPQNPQRFGNDNLYHANFSCFGDEIICAAPGVGIISTVPARFSLSGPYASMDGTSMASPAACAMLAALLSVDPGYGALVRNETRAGAARRALVQACQDVGLKAIFQGHGVPTTT